MEDINFTVVAFSIAAYIIGALSGYKSGFIRAIQSIPVTVLKISDDLDVEEK